MNVRLIEVRDPAELEPALASIARQDATAIALVPGTFLLQYQNVIGELAIKRRLAVLGWNRALAESVLISYGPNLAEIFRRAASHVAKILKGAKPADLPVEQPTKVDLVINLKTAKALSLTIPQSLLLRADEIIQ